MSLEVIVTIFGIVITIIFAFFLERLFSFIKDQKRELEKQQARHDILKDKFEQLALIIKEMLRDEVIRTHKLYIEQGLSNYDFEEVNKMYDFYKSLGGNGYVETLVMEIKREIKKNRS